MLMYFKLFHKHMFKNLTILSFTILITAGCGDTQSGGSGNDRIEPVITLNGEKHIIINKNESFQDPGATALDNFDGDISAHITKSSNLNESKHGEYTITYSVEDKAGNQATKKRTISVIDVLTPQAREGLTINEVLVSNTYTNIDSSTNQFSGWVELYNNTNSSINLNGYNLSDGTKRWNFPSISIAAHRYLLIWTDGTDIGLHTNFKLDMDGESIILSRSNTIIDSITFPEQKSDISFTKQNDTLYYMTPTPTKANSQASSVLLRSKKVDYSLENSFYNTTQRLTLTQINGGTIYYTTDGSIPTKGSRIYTSPITIDKNSVIRTRALESYKFMSSVKNRSYFIQENVSIPVISLAINDAYLNDNTIGIYTKGTGSTPNYRYDWMRAGSIEYIKDGKSQFSENIGVRIHGQTSRENAKKSLNIYAKDKFGPKSIKYKLFADKNINKFKSLVLKNGGDDATHRSSLIQNALMHYIVKDNMDIDYVSYQPCVMFINGKYWGVYNIREKDNEDYIEANHGVDSKLVEYIRINGVLTNPRSTHYQNMISQVNNYDFVSSSMDIDEYINYIIAEVYDANNDWPSTNTTGWRELSDKGIWRWVLNDTDNGFSKSDYDTLAILLDGNSNSYPNYAWSTKLFRTLMQNSDFRQKFITRFTTHLNTTFTTQRVYSIVEQMTSVVAPEMDRDFSRWSTVNKTTSWSTLRNSLYSFANNRTAIMRSYLRNNLSLSGDNTLSIDSADKGTVVIDGVKLTNSYNGHYFNNASVLLSAIPIPGYTLDKWLINGTEYRTKTLLLEFSNNTTVEAIFTPFSGPNIVINEINLKSEKSFDAGDWIELYNNDSSTIDLSGWVIKDKLEIAGFTIPEGTVLRTGEYLILTEDKAKFKELFPSITRVIGDLPFGISSKGDSLYLYNQNSTLVDSLLFDQNWIATVGTLIDGYTLSLNNPNDDNSRSGNWSFIYKHGTPGSAN